MADSEEPPGRVFDDLEVIAARMVRALDPDGLHPGGEPHPLRCAPLTVGEALAALTAAGYGVVRLPEHNTPVGHAFIVDQADEARRGFGVEAAEAIRGGPLPDHDYRLHVVTPTGCVTHRAGATADEVINYG